MRPQFILAGALAGVAPVFAQEPYRLPPDPIPAMLDAPTLPQALVSPDRAWLLLLEQPSLPAITDLAAPMLRLAGSRIDPRTTGPRLGARITSLVLTRLADGTQRRIATPASANLGAVQWAPDGRHIAFTHTRADGIELWVADAATGEARAVTGPTLNATMGAPCSWLSDATRLVCRFVPDNRGPAPATPTAPEGPVTQESTGRPAPVRTWQDLLTDTHDEALFDHYFRSQIAIVDAQSGARIAVAGPAIYDRVDPSPDGRHLLVIRTVRPYSFLVPGFLFPKEIEAWTIDGRVLRRIADLPLADRIPIRGVRPGPRAIGWRPGAPATLTWAEALDGGDPATRVPHRDRVVLLAAPFVGDPVELLRLETRFAGAVWDAATLALVSEYDRDRRWTRTWLADAARPGAPPRPVWNRSAEDRYGNPGTPVLVSSAAGDPVLLRDGDAIWLVGAGASPTGERPFLDRLDLRTLRTERRWRADSTHYETILALVDDRGRSVLTRRESRREPPNYFVRDVRTGRLRALTTFADPAPQLTGVEKRLLTYTREDGVPLSGTLYLPPDYRPGTRLPVLMWAYPTEFASADAAGQVTAAPNRFTFYRGASHLFLLTQGYAVFDDPKMPIIGGDTANNHYIEQLVMSARAAVKAVVDAGVADPERIGVGGHSYGAFMTANLLAHSDLFRAGVARSGAYNRTLTPFGFQNEDRTYWEAPGVYDAMSPFQNATRIDEPLLLIHGEADNNSGTFPIQSERLYHALTGLGRTSRLVVLPHESHGYAARESVLHTLAEMTAWLDRYVKRAAPRPAAREGPRTDR
jgi:dipeptidyl aminopeptidase/acylaminoacyl peptidase